LIICWSVAAVLAVGADKKAQTFLVVAAAQAVCSLLLT
jgi:hypothetical protein